MERIGEQKREDVVAEKDSEMERAAEKAVRMMKRETERKTGRETEKETEKEDKEGRRRGRRRRRAEQKIILLSNNGRPKERTQDNLRTTSPVQVPQKNKFSIKKSSDHTKNIFFDAIKTTIDYVWKKSFKCHSTGSSKQRTSMGTG